MLFQLARGLGRMMLLYSFINSGVRNHKFIERLFFFETNRKREVDGLDCTEQMLSAIFRTRVDSV